MAPWAPQGFGQLIPSPAQRQARSIEKAIDGAGDGNRTLFAVAPAMGHRYGLGDVICSPAQSFCNFGAPLGCENPRTAFFMWPPGIRSMAFKILSAGAPSLPKVGQYFLHEPPELGFLLPGRDAQQDVGCPGINECL